MDKQKYGLTLVPTNWLISLAPCSLMQVAISVLEILDNKFKPAKVGHKSCWASKKKLISGSSSCFFIKPLTATTNTGTTHKN
ncbi:Putative protein [Zobellia galactanivorans]|uniref:Uncharacterized protein n=1 Tax=Zobellia galactanivorans (strain DSM 12802 / CCUG 47099 / CIP 106680 / NCIMB 13871 / Dsij) TaxID=63186 RepID=G0KZG6_ZOBGA|nr:Putative protein [Zobellia galactanivorans]